MKKNDSDGISIDTSTMATWLTHKDQPFNNETEEAKKSVENIISDIKENLIHLNHNSKEKLLEITNELESYNKTIDSIDNCQLVQDIYTTTQNFMTQFKPEKFRETFESLNLPPEISDYNQLIILAFKIYLVRKGVIKTLSILAHEKNMQNEVGKDISLINYAKIITQIEYETGPLISNKLAEDFIIALENTKTKLSQSLQTSVLSESNPGNKLVETKDHIPKQSKQSNTLGVETGSIKKLSSSSKELYKQSSEEQMSGNLVFTEIHIAKKNSQGLDNALNALNQMLNGSIISPERTFRMNLQNELKQYTLKNKENKISIASNKLNIDKQINSDEKQKIKTAMKAAINSIIDIGGIYQGTTKKKILTVLLTAFDTENDLSKLYSIALLFLKTTACHRNPSWTMKLFGSKFPNSYNKFVKIVGTEILNKLLPSNTPSQTP